MEWWRPVLLVSCLVLTAAGIAYFRGERNYRPNIAAEAARPGSVSLTRLFAGGPPQEEPGVTYYEVSGFDVGEGKRLYKWFNCVGCHANGGGDVGPALMDDKWIYGAEPRNIFETIAEGRPNGMPAFRNKIPEAQVWQIVAYVRSMSGLVPFYARPGRSDDLQAKPSETLTPPSRPIDTQREPPGGQAGQ